MIKTVLKIGSLNIISLILLFLSSVIIINNVMIDIYGKYVYIIALIAIVPIFYNTFDILMLRYGVEESKEKQSILFSTLIYCKIMIYFFVSILLYYYINYFEEDFLQSGIFFNILILLFIKELLSVLSTSLTTLINVFEKYILISVFSVVNSGVFVLFLLILTFIFKISDLIFIYYVVLYQFVYTFLSVIFLLYTAKKITKIKFNFMIFNKNMILDRVKYFLPLQLVSIQSYFKLYLPQIFLGNLSTFDNVAYYDIVRKIYHIIHKFIPKITNLFLPSFVKNKNDDIIKFTARYNTYSFIYMSIITIVGVILILLSKQILWLFGIGYEYKIIILFVLFSFDLYLGALAQIFTIYIKTTHSTKSIFISSFVRDVVGSLISYILIAKYMLLGAAISRNINTLLLNVTFIVTSYKEFKNLHLFRFFFFFIGITIMYSIIGFYYWRLAY